MDKKTYGIPCVLKEKTAKKILHEYFRKVEIVGHLCNKDQLYYYVSEPWIDMDDDCYGGEIRGITSYQVAIIFAKNLHVLFMQKFGVSVSDVKEFTDPEDGEKKFSVLLFNQKY